MSAYLEQLEPGNRCRKWKLVVSVGSGKERRRKSKIFEGGKREAQSALKEFEQITHIPVIRSSFEQFALSWNERRLKSGAIAPSTHDKYYWHIAAVSPYLSQPLENIRPSDIMAAYAELGGLWSGSTLLSLHNSLRRIFLAAQSEGLIGVSPMSGVDAPKSDTKEKVALSPSAAKQLLSELDISDNRQFAISMVLRCGLRKSELLGLEWRDVDDMLHVRREITKSDAGVRDIPLDEETMKMIETRRALISAALACVGSELYPTDKLCCGLDGRPLTQNALRKFWDRHRTKYSNCTLHELRHTYLTNLAQAGVHPSVMQRLAGHASARVTMNIYTHVHNEDLKKAVNSLAELRHSAPEAAPGVKR